MDILKATRRYEEWLATELTIVQPDLELKHERMAAALFSFFRATYYRWAQLWPEVCGHLASAPKVLAVGDLHIENFGTWRDSEARLVWGVNDFDETWPLSYTNDLVRLAASAQMAIAENHLPVTIEDAAQAILEGYTEWMTRGGCPFVLAEYHAVLREIAVHRLKEVHTFWEKLGSWPTVRGKIPASAVKGITRLLPEPDLPCRYVHRVAGLGSLGRQRFVALADWQGAKIAREAKAMAPSACWWAMGAKGFPQLRYQEILDTAVRCCDPYVKLKGAWVVRRLAPDCSRIELSALPRERDHFRLLRAMGAETANVHLAGQERRAILRDLKRRANDWLSSASGEMVKAITRDWEEWRKASAPSPRSPHPRRGKVAGR
jgi:hypothetical protein